MSIKERIKHYKFGVELEFMAQDRGTVTEWLGYKMGWEAGGAVDEWYLVDDKGRDWSIREDGSVSTRDGEWDACELISPPLTLEDLPTLLKLVNFLQYEDVDYDSSCGMHVHIDAELFNAKSIGRLVELFLRFEDALFEGLKVHPRRERNYTKRLSSHGKATFIPKAESLEEIGAFWYKVSHDDPDYYYNSTRYFALNLHAIWMNGTIEFRLFNGTIDPEEVEENILICLGLADLAINRKHLPRPKGDTKEQYEQLIKTIKLQELVNRKLIRRFAV